MSIREKSEIYAFAFFAFLPMRSVFLLFPVEVEASCPAVVWENLQEQPQEVFLKD